MAEGDTLANALLGAVVSIVLSFTLVSPLLGGLLAGYLQGGDRGDGLRVGAISGVVALVPMLGFVFLVGGVLGFFLVGGVPPSVGAVGVAFVLVVLVTSAAYTVGLSALGGWLGNYVRTDTDLGA